MMATGLITSRRFLDHDTGPGHPESPRRLTAITDDLETSGLLDKLRVYEPRQKDPSVPALVHSADYISRFEAACINGEPVMDSVDNPICPDTFDVALLAAGASVQAVDCIFSREVENAMVLLRPPGHHAEKNSAQGFCFFNNVAIAAQYARQQYNPERIAIIDFDVHHGNGTQHIFESDPNVLYISLHRYPFYPGTGDKSETGIGAGLGTTVNYPLNAGSGDDIYLDIVKGPLTDRVLGYQPDFLILSSGFDAHELDPLGGMSVTTEGYRRMTREFKRLAVECCRGRLLSVLEGGYDLKGLSESVHAHLEVLLGESK